MTDYGIFCFICLIYIYAVTVRANKIEWANLQNVITSTRHIIHLSTVDE